MAKRFKLKFTIPSFQMCRSKDLSSFPGNPVPAIYRLSPVNPKAHDIGYPNLSAPPTTPQQQGKVSISHGCHMCRDHEDNKVESRGRKSTSSVPSRRSDLVIDTFNNHDEEESETLISCLTSFSDEFCHDEILHYSPGSASHKPEKELVGRHRRKISSVKKVQKLRFHTLENRRGPESNTGQVKKTTMRSKASTTRSTVEKKVKESFAVVKKSKDPYADFKKSMLEMIREMEMYEAEDLEQLLQCFLALNSRSYHAVIVRAFMEIWQQMFTWKPTYVHQKSANIR